MAKKFEQPPVPKRHQQQLNIIQKRMFNHLLAGNSLTALDCFTMFGCLNTSQRLGEIRRFYNVPIQSEFEFTPSGKRIKRYFLPAQFIKDYTSGKIPPIFDKDKAKTDQSTDQSDQSKAN